MSKVSFFRAFFGACRGTAIFEELKDQSFLRLGWHLLLLALLMGIGFDLLTGARLHSEIKNQAAGLSAQIGTVKCCGGRITPVKEPEKMRRCELLNGGVLYYLPDGKMPRLTVLEYSLHPYYLFWQPDRLTGATLFTPGQWRITAFQPPGGPGKPAKLMTGSGSTPFAAADTQTMTLHEGMPEAFQLDGGALAEEIYLAALVHVPAVFHFFSILFLTVAEVLFFALVFHLTGGTRKLRYLSFVQFLKTGFYAAFPPLAFATLFPALDLPFLRFSTVFMLGTVFYWLYVINTLENQHLNEGGSLS